MEDRALEPARERLAELGPLLHREPILAQRFVLGLELRDLRRISGQAETPGAPEGVAGQFGEALEVALGQLPQRSGPLGTELRSRHVVRQGTAAQREAAVAAARATGDLSRLVNAHAQPCAREDMGARAAGHATAHHGYVDPLVVSSPIRD